MNTPLKIVTSEEQLIWLFKNEEHIIKQVGRERFNKMVYELEIDLLRKSNTFSGVCLRLHEAWLELQAALYNRFKPLLDFIMRILQGLTS